MSDAQTLEQHHFFPWLAFILIPTMAIASTVISLASMG